MVVSREQLYEEVWAEPMGKVGWRYDVSGSFIARVCDRLNVPRPPMGYWAKLAVGKAPVRPPLPPARPGDEIEWIRWTERSTVQRALPVPPGQNAASAAPEVTAPTPGSRPRRKHRGPHPLVVGSEAHFLKGRESRYGYLIPDKQLLVDLFVSRETLRRALDMASRIFLALEARGHRVVLVPRDAQLCGSRIDEREEPRDGEREYDWKSWRPKRPTVGFVGSVPIGLKLYEISEVVEVDTEEGNWRGPYFRVSDLPPTGRSFVQKRDMPTGRLCLLAFCADPRASWSRRWSETKAGGLKRKVDEIAVELEENSAAIAKLIEEGHREAEIRRLKREAELREWQRNEDERRRAEAIVEKRRRRTESVRTSREQLLSIIDDWGRAIRIESFFADAERRAATLEEEARAAFAIRVSRARELLGRLDAMERFRSWASPEDVYAQAPAES